MNNSELSQQVVVALGERTLATAESLTGGLIGAMITAVPGSSKVYRGGVITYATDLKSSMLDIPSATMSHGVVSKEVASAMAVGVAYFLNAEFAISTTGVAGPEPQEGHPPGTVYISVFQRGRDGAPKSVTEKLTLVAQSADEWQGREEIRQATVQAALNLLLTFLV